MGSGFQDAVQKKATVQDIVNPNDQAHGAIASYKKKFELLMPKGGDADQIVADAIQMLEANPKLRECDPMSVLGGLVTISQLNLRPGVLGQAWLIPMWNSRVRGFQATLVVGYQGFLALGYRSSEVKHVESRVVYEGDAFTFDYDYERLVHGVDITREKGAPIAFYAVVHLKNGHTHVERPMTVREMEEHRDRYAMAKKKDGTVVGPWVSDFEAMAKKTMVLRALKYLPKSVAYQQAEEVDQTVRTNVVERSPENAIDARAIEGLLTPDSPNDDEQSDGDAEFPAEDATNEQ